MTRSVPCAVIAHAVAGAVIGAGAALIVGLVMVVLAPNNGFADLAAAAVTRVVLIPLGAVVGGVAGYRSGR
jgi:hypothetical protein